MKKIAILNLLLVIVLICCKTNNIVDVSNQVKIKKIVYNNIPISYIIEEIDILETARNNPNVDIGLSLKIKIINNSNTIQRVQLLNAQDIFDGNIIGLYNQENALISFVNNFEKPILALNPKQEYLYECTSVLFCYEDLFERKADYQESMIKLLSRIKFKYIRNNRSLIDTIDIGIDHKLKVFCID